MEQCCSTIFTTNSTEKLKQAPEKGGPPQVGAGIRGTNLEPQTQNINLGEEPRDYYPTLHIFHR